MADDPHLRMAELDLPEPIPTHIEQLARLATRLVYDDVVAGRVSFLMLLTFDGSKARVWQLHGATEPDDIARAIIQREAPQAIAFVHPMPLPHGVEGDRGYNVAVETRRGKYDQLIALRGGSGLGGDESRLYGRTVTEPHRWLGVAPEGDVQIWYEGVVGGMGPSGEA